MFQKNAPPIGAEIGASAPRGVPPIQQAPTQAAPLELAALSLPSFGFLRSTDQIQQTQRVIATLFALSSGRGGLQLLPHANMWACGFAPETEARIQDALRDGSLDLDSMTDEQFQPDAFYYNTADIPTRGVPQIYGVTHHEAAHAQYTSFRNLIRAHRIAEHEGKLPTSIGLLLNGVEDGRINRIKSCESEVIRSHIDSFYREWEKETVPQIASQSLMRQFSLNAVHVWLHGESIPKGLDPRVMRAFETAEPAIRRYMNENSREAAFQVMRDEIWPATSHLEAEDLKDQQLRQHREHKRNWLSKIMRKMFGGNQRAPIPPDERQKLQSEVDQLPQGQRQKLEQEARRSLDKHQAEEYAKDGPKGFSFKPDPKSGKQRLQRSNVPTKNDRNRGEGLREDAVAKDAERAAKELERQKKQGKMRREGFGEREESLFDHFERERATALQPSRALVRHFEEIVPRAAKHEFSGDFHSGKRVELKKLAQRAPIGDSRLHQRRTTVVPAEPLLYTELILDNTKSMEGQKILQLRRATIMALEALDELELPSCAKTFAENFTWLQQRGARYSDPHARVKPTLISQMNGTEFNTNIGAPLEECLTAHHRFALDNPKTTLLTVVISDGEANYGKTGDELRALISAVRRRSIVVNINLASAPKDLENAENLFGAEFVVACRDADQLPNELTRVLRKAFQQAAEKRRRVG